MSSPENTLDPRALGSAGSPVGGDGVVYAVEGGGRPGRFPVSTAVDDEGVALVTLGLVVIGIMAGRGSVRGGLRRSGRRRGATVALVVRTLGLTASLIVRTSAASSSSLLNSRC